MVPAVTPEHVNVKDSSKIDTERTQSMNIFFSLLKYFYRYMMGKSTWTIHHHSCVHQRISREYDVMILHICFSHMDPPAGEGLHQMSSQMSEIVCVVWVTGGQDLSNYFSISLHFQKLLALFISLVGKYLTVAANISLVCFTFDYLHSYWKLHSWHTSQHVQHVHLLLGLLMLFMSSPSFCTK